MIEDSYNSSGDLPPSNNKKKILLIGGGVVLLLVIGVIVFFALKGDDTTEIPNPIVTQNSSEQPIATTSVPLVDPYPNDKDRDGIDDTKEKELGTSNRDFDTDGDGLSDSDELDVWKTDPTKLDTDGDKFSDGYEVLNGYNPAGEGKLK